jgi:hypothetical protein
MSLDALFCTINPKYKGYSTEGTSVGLEGEILKSRTDEIIQHEGVDVFYLQRELQNLDMLWGEDPRSKFVNEYRMKMMLVSFEGYEGERDFYSKFGMQVNDEISLEIGFERFRLETNLKQPRQGDLMYLPLANALFEITFSDDEEPFYAFNTRSKFAITAQKFIYSGEEFDLHSMSAVPSYSGTHDMGMPNIFTTDADLIAYGENNITDPNAIVLLSALEQGRFGYGIFAAMKHSDLSGCFGYKSDHSGGYSEWQITNTFCGDTFNVYSQVQNDDPNALGGEVVDSTVDPEIIETVPMELDYSLDYTYEYGANDDAVSAIGNLINRLNGQVDLYETPYTQNTLIDDESRPKKDLSEGNPFGVSY